MNGKPGSQETLSASAGVVTSREEPARALGESDLKWNTHGGVRGSVRPGR